MSAKVNRFMQTFLFICWLALVLPAAAPAQVGYELTLDGRKSARAGAENLLTFHRALTSVQDRYLKLRWSAEDTRLSKALGVTYRLSKTVLVDNVIDHVAFLVQHEVFGHGSRLREFGYERNSYSISLIPPYGNASGLTRSGRGQPGRLHTQDEGLAVVTGGSEANTLLSNSIRRRWLLKGLVPSREAPLYLLTANDLSAYVVKTWARDNPGPGNDVINYLDNVNAREGYFGRTNHHLSEEDLGKQVLLNALNPFQYVSLYSYFVDYVWRGRSETALPTIGIGKYGYLPSLRLSLTPFGSQIHFDNFVVKGDRLVTATFRYGVPTFHRFGGVGVSVENLATTNAMSFSAGVDVWHQPGLLLGGSEVAVKGSGWGGAASGKAVYTLKRTEPSVGILLEGAYKTAGFLEGERLRSGVTTRFGLSFSEW